MNSELQVLVSPVCNMGAEHYAFVSFSDGERVAEGRIPECVLLRNQGFTEEEAEQLIDYMRAHLRELKKTAAGINPLGAFMKDPE